MKHLAVSALWFRIGATVVIFSGCYKYNNITI
jgi:hypothetical protein